MEDTSLIQQHQELEKLRTGYLEYMAEHTRSRMPEGLYEPVNYIMNLGGKHLRPVLLLAAVKAMNKDWKQALPAAFGLEMFHNFTLVHDDVMDKADLRRGEETVHLKYGLDAAILSGDVMMMKSVALILSCTPKEVYDKVASSFLQTGIRICEGQQLDMDFEKETSPDLDDYLHMIEGKTAVLPAEALRIGGWIAGGQDEVSQGLYEFGRNLGMAFQMQDDLLDAFGDQDKVGKVVGGDIRQNKKTVLFIVGMKLMDEAQKKRVIELFSSDDTSDAKVEEVKSIWYQSGVVEYVHGLKRDYHNKSLKILSQLADSGLDIGLLNFISEQMLNRHS